MNDWVMPPLSAGETMNVQVKAHYRQSPIPAELSIDPDGSVRAAYLEPRQAAAPGQALVAYVAIRWLAAAPLLKPSSVFAVAPFDFDCALKNARSAQVFGAGASTPVF